MRPILITALGLALAPTAIGAEATTGEIRLASGTFVRYEYHFNRNALRSSRIEGDSLVALTESGNLLRFDVKTLTITREWTGLIPATCLGRGEGGSILVGFEDGHVRRVDSTTLAMTDVAKLPHRPVWVGHREAGLVAVVEVEGFFEAGGRRYPSKTSAVVDLGSGKTYPNDRRSSAFLLDSHDRLWLGGDRGEWGGWCTVVDLKAGKALEVPGIKERPNDGGSGWDGVYGFVELRDGQVWAFGGTMHMGFTQGFVRRVDGASVEDLFRSNNTEQLKARWEGRDPPKTDRPTFPITRMIEQPNGRLLIFSYNDVDRADRSLRTWTSVANLKINYRFGRPDAVGSYPSVVDVHPLSDCRLVCATALDGYVVIRGGKAKGHEVSGQCGADDVEEIVNTTEEMFFLPGNDREPIWTLGEKGWATAKLEPPKAANPEADDNGAGLSETRLLVGPKDILYTVSGNHWNPGPRVTARWEHGRPVVLGRERLDLYVSESFITPDGTIWNASDGLLRFDQGSWVTVRDRTERVDHLLAMKVPGPPWTLLDRNGSRLLILTGGNVPGLATITIKENEEIFDVLDAFPWRDGELLLATGRGLRIYQIETEQLAKSKIQTPGFVARRIVRDGLGRVWLAGDGLRVADPESGKVELCDLVPAIGAMKVWAIAPDPRHPDGIIAAMGRRGIVRLRVEPGR